MAQRQNGATLLVAIMMLLIITLLAISSMRGVSLESRITGNLKQQKMLTNAAEAALRLGEVSISTKSAPIPQRPCTSTVCLPWSWSPLAPNPELAVTDNIDLPTRFDDAANVATDETSYEAKIQWYVVDLGKLGDSSMNGGALLATGVRYYEVNACASTVLCTSDTVTQRVMLRTVIARYYPN
ncbi:MAG TPA: PilX N-terminal domain-containing pilus assembly protein [Pseudomonas sp.]